MIDTIKIYTYISKTQYDIISSLLDIKTSYNVYTGEIFYRITSGHLKGSYDSSLAVRCDYTGKYGYYGYVLELEGSPHKLTLGHNAFNGYYNFVSACSVLINIASSFFGFDLPLFRHWFCNRVDIALCFDLLSQDNVNNYINNLSSCSYARRGVADIYDGSLYCKGSTTTLKIYNKLKEFNVHDFGKLSRQKEFDLYNFTDKIKGYVRFEVEIKKKKLKKLYNNKRNIRITNINYSELKNVWSDEFMKLLKLYENEMYIVHERSSVEERLQGLFKPCKARNLYNFFNSLIVDGYDVVKSRYTRTTFWRNINDLKKSGVDFSQQYDLTITNKIMEFNPFLSQEVI